MSVPFEMIETLAQELARYIDRRVPKGWGFTLLIFSHGPAGLLTYVSDSERSDMVKVLEEFQRLLEGGRELTDTDITVKCWCCDAAPAVQFKGTRRVVHLCATCLGNMEQYDADAQRRRPREQ